MNFWQMVPYEYKKNQLLYKEFVYQNNWGGVWNDIPVNSIKISPIWLRYLRVGFKILCIPFGKSNWRKFERKFVLFYSEILGLDDESSSNEKYDEILELILELREKERLSKNYDKSDYIRDKLNELGLKINDKI